MAKIRNWVNLDESDSTSEKPNKIPSMTVPDLSLSVAQLVERMQMGLPPEGERVPIFDEGSEFPDLSRMDLVDRQNYIAYYTKLSEELLTPKEKHLAATKELEDAKEETIILDAAYRDKILAD